MVKDWSTAKQTDQFYLIVKLLLLSFHFSVPLLISFSHIMSYAPFDISQFICLNNCKHRPRSFWSIVFIIRSGIKWMSIITGIESVMYLWIVSGIENFDIFFIVARVEDFVWFWIIGGIKVVVMYVGTGTGIENILFIAVIAGNKVAVTIRFVFRIEDIDIVWIYIVSGTKFALRFCVVDGTGINWCFWIVAGAKYIVYFYIIIVMRFRCVTGIEHFDIVGLYIISGTETIMCVCFMIRIEIMTCFYSADFSVKGNGGLIAEI